MHQIQDNEICTAMALSSAPVWTRRGISTEHHCSCGCIRYNWWGKFPSAACNMLVANKGRPTEFQIWRTFRLFQGKWAPGGEEWKQPVFLDGQTTNQTCRKGKPNGAHWWANSIIGGSRLSMGTKNERFQRGWIVKCQERVGLYEKHGHVKAVKHRSPLSAWVKTNRGEGDLERATIGCSVMSKSDCWMKLIFLRSSSYSLEHQASGTRQLLQETRACECAEWKSFAQLDKEST